VTEGEEQALVQHVRASSDPPTIDAKRADVKWPPDKPYDAGVSGEPRRDPEEFLRRAKEEEVRRSRGRLKVFFGAAAGVGKTYAMLEAARQQREAGVDVVIGVVETHRRPETEKLLVGLDTVSPRLVEYRGVVLKELDVDAAIARRPTLILVDELAHTNAPGGRHAKRWQDVLELRDAGIDVYTTVNVQHLESLNDVVGKITGVAVRETIPDSVFAQADEIELVDLSPEDLRRRLEAGKVYIPERAGEAMRHFFREGNLIALRELALRCVADHVDAQMQRYRRDRAVAPTWPVVERIMVCIGPDPLSARLVRAGRRLATRLGAPWVVAYVETPAHARMSEEVRARIAATLRLAERLGAETTTLTGPTVSDEVLAYARSRNVSQILIGKPARPLWRRILVGSDVDALVRGSGDINISVISGEREPDELDLPRVRSRAPLSAYGLALLAVLVSTSVGYLMFPSFEVSNIAMTYMLGVVAVARKGHGPALLAALLSVAAFDFFFVPPYYSFAVRDTQYLVTLAVMLIVALVISDLTVRVTRQAEAARIRERRTAALYRLDQELADTHGVTELLEVGIRHVVDILDGQIAILLPDDQGHLQPRASLMSAFQLEPKDVAVAQWTYEHRQPAGAGAENLPRGEVLFLPLRGSRGAVGVLAIRPSRPGTLDDAELRRVLGAFANQIALAIERSLLTEEAQRARRRIEAEELRSSLLTSVSQDLQTPLTSITRAATALAANGNALDGPARRELAEVIRAEADQLHRLVSNLLDMTRLESGAARLHRANQSLGDVIRAAVGRMGQRLEGHPVSTNLPPTLPLVLIDRVLIEQVFFNLLDNAVKYTPESSPIEISAETSNGVVTVAFADRGPGLPPDILDRVFEKFYRAKSATSPGGAGLGLTICRAIVSAHGGRIWAENRLGGGLVFRFTLPLLERPPASVGTGT
jgi:two-component system sensor histidine kinase KdpD